jgi:peptide methionine sulfoxide reductase MsrA
MRRQAKERQMWSLRRKPLEDYHQQYLAKNPAGYCGLGGTGVHCPGA